MKNPGRPTETHAGIEENLKKVYREIADEDIPDRFMSLLERLRDRDRDDAPASALETEEPR